MRRRNCIEEYMNEAVSYGGIIVPRYVQEQHLDSMSVTGPARLVAALRRAVDLPLWSISGHVIGEAECLRLIYNE